MDQELDAHIAITKVEARVVIADIQQDPSDKTIAYVQQRFSINFSEKEGTVGMSGNPGYLVGMPLLVGVVEMVEDDEEDGPDQRAVITFQGGFVVTASKPNGECWEDYKEIHAQLDDPIATFGVDLSYGCTLSLTKSELETLC